MRDTLTVHNMTVAPWEIPVIEYVFEEGNVTRSGEFVDVPDRDYPDPTQEYMRLTRVYGSENETGIPHAVSVFGSARNGVRALTKAINEAREADEEAEADAPPKVAQMLSTSNRKRSRYSADPLMN